MSDAPTDVTTESDKSRNRAAARPCTNTIGPNTRIVVSVPAVRGPDTSSVATSAACPRGSPSACFRADASATTIALSISRPTPSASPPSDRTFTVTSRPCSSTSATSTDSGTIRPIAIESRQSRRNTSITTSDNAPPRMISCPRFERASTTKSACSATTFSVMPGNSDCSCSTTLSSSFVTDTVLEPASL